VSRTSDVREPHESRDPRCDYSCYIASKEGKISEWRIGKDVEGSGRGLI